MISCPLCGFPTARDRGHPARCLAEVVALEAAPKDKSRPLTMRETHLLVEVNRFFRVPADGWVLAFTEVR